jgi:TRAP-type C4-dicarboxylate transport system permease small subunit
MRRIAAVLGRVASIASQSGLVVGALLIAYMAIHILTEIAIRAAFSASTFLLDEMVGYAVAGMTFLALGATFRDGEHIRVGILTQALRGRPRLVLEIVCVLALAVALAALDWFTFAAMQRFWMRGTLSHTGSGVPLWLPMSVLVAGVTTCLLQAAAYLAHLLAGGPMMADSRNGDEGFER